MDTSIDDSDDVTGSDIPTHTKDDWYFKMQRIHVNHADFWICYS
jgi:hypothetical protein